jgi:hypothetical protein
MATSRSTASRSTASTAASTGLVWEEPPATVRPGSSSPDKYRAEAEELKAHPGKWAVLAEFKDRSQAYRLKSSVEKAKYPAFAPAGSFEGKTHTNGAVKVYVRYVGETEAQPESEGGEA